MTDQDVASSEAFDYAELCGEDWRFCQDARDEIKRLGKQTGQNIIEIGRLLTEVKGRLTHGQFGRWLAAEFKWSDRHARRFMAAHQTFGKTDIMSEFASFLEPTAVYELAAPSTPEPARQEVLAKVERGEKVTTKEVKATVERHKQPLSKPQKMRRQWDAMRRAHLGEERAEAFVERHPEVNDRVLRAVRALDSLMPRTREACEEWAATVPVASRSEVRETLELLAGSLENMAAALGAAEPTEPHLRLVPPEPAPEELAQEIADAMPEAKGNGAERPRKTFTCQAPGCGTVFEAPRQRGRPFKFCPTHRTSRSAATAEG
jgi:Protein of unknown function (DUF3102)